MRVRAVALLLYALAPWSDAPAQAPSARERLCGDKGVAEGVIAGTVVQAATSAPMEDATLRVRWFEMTVVKGKLASAPVERVAHTDDQGMFSFCSLPASGDVRLTVGAPGFHTIEGDVTLDPGELWIRELRLASAESKRGPSAITGTVSRADGSNLQSGLARLPALALEAAIVNGKFAFRELPAGSWVVDVAAIGFEPQQLWVDASDQPTPVRVAMQQMAQKLQAENVVGKPGMDLKILQQMHERSLISGGTRILPGNSALETAMVASDVLSVARGFRLRSETVVEGRLYASDTVGMAPCLSGSGGTGGRGKQVAIYLDGERWYGGLESINNHVPAKDLLAVEAYPDVISAPFLWRTNDACAVIVFWTKHSVQ